MILLTDETRKNTMYFTVYTSTWTF